MPGIENFTSFLLAATLMIVSPGPSSFYVLSRTRRSSWQAGYATLGVVMADIVLITFAGLGFASLVSQWPLLLLLVKLGGAVYVAYLGWDVLRTAQSQNVTSDAVKKPREGDGFIRGALITLSNPKSILFFAVFFPIFIKTDAASTMSSFYVLGIYFELLNVSYFALLILLMARLRQWPVFDRFLAGSFNTVSGVGLLCCSGLIIATILF